MQLAIQEAQLLHHEYIGTEHILLGLVEVGSGVAARVLRELKIDLRAIRNEIEKIVQHGPGGPDAFVGRLPQTPRTKKVIEFSIQEARDLNNNYVGTEHLLLGLLREQEGVAAQVLINLGLRTETVREEIRKQLSWATTEDGSTQPMPLSDQQIEFVRARIERLNRQASRFQAEAESLRRLLEWDQWYKNEG